MANASEQMTQADNGGDFRVVVFATADDPHQFRDLLVQQLSMHPTDAMILVHSTPGILPEHLDGEQAEQLVAAIEEMGIAAEVISTADIPDFTRAPQVHNVHLADDGLSILGPSGEQSALIRWNDVEMISVGQIPGELTRHYFFDNDVTFTASRRRYIAPDEVAGTATMVLWLLCDKCRQGYRIEKTHMNFSELGARMTPSASANFHLFVQEIAARSDSAYLTPATHTFLGHGTLRHVQFSSEQELERYTAFHLILRERLRQLEAN